MSSDVTLTVIVPNYNHAPYLEQRIKTIINQTCQDFEIILMDDCSTDNSLEILNKYSKHPKVSKIIRNKENSGSTFHQWIKGIKQARGKYIWIAESDDFSDCRFIENVLEVLLKNPLLSLVYTQSMDVNQEGKELGSRLYWTEEYQPNIWDRDFVLDGNDFIKKYLLDKNPIPNASAVIFDKNAFLNSYDETVVDMRMLGDWLLWVAIIANNKVGFISKPLNYFRHHYSSTRVHNTKSKKRRRVREEAIVLHKIRSLNLLTDDVYTNRKYAILTRWITQFPKYRGVVKSSFYEICKDAKVSPFKLIFFRISTFFSS